VPFTAAVVLATAVACSASGGSGNGETLTVFAASSLTEAFSALAGAFEAANPGTSVELNFSGSQRLRVQLEHGAGADVYASADGRQMDMAQTFGLLHGEQVDFASNSMVVAVSPRAAGKPENPEADGSGIRSLSDLAGEGVKLALAHPEVPAGVYSRRVIENLAQDPHFGPSFLERVLDNVVSEEPNVRSVLQKVALGEVDAGIVYLTDAGVAPDLSMIPVPDWANLAATYPAAVLRNESQRSIADAFLRFLTSPQGQTILQNHGFGPPPPGAGPRSSRKVVEAVGALPWR